MFKMNIRNVWALPSNKSSSIIRLLLNNECHTEMCQAVIIHHVE